MSDNKCWSVKQDTDDLRFDHVQFSEHPSVSWPQKQLTLDGSVHKFHTNTDNYAWVLPDLEEDNSNLIKSVRKEPEEDYRCYQEAKQCTDSVPHLPVMVHKRVVSRRYVFVPDFPGSHAALKTFCGSESVRDNSSAVYAGVFSNWKNEMIELSCSTHRTRLPSMLRLMTSNDCGISDQAVKQSIRRLMTYKKTSHLYALYSAMKALAAFHPRSISAVSSHILDKLPEKRSEEPESTRGLLILDYIVSCVELELLHYPMIRQRCREVSKLVAIDSPLVRRLTHETENRCGDIKTLALLQRAVAAIGMSDKWLFINQLVTKLYRLYRHIRHVPDRHQLLASIAKPQLRAKLAEYILVERCCSYVRPPLKQFLTIDSVRALSALLSEWLGANSSSAAIGKTTDQVEEYLSVVLTYMESNLHVHKGLLLFKDFGPVVGP